MGTRINKYEKCLPKQLGFLRRNLTFAPKSTKEVAYKTLVRPKLEYAALSQNFRLIRWIKFRGKQLAVPAGNGETQVVPARILMGLCGQLLGPEGIGPPCFSFIVVLCL